MPIYPKEWEWRELEIGEKVVLIAGPVTGIEIGSVGTVKDRHVSPRKKRRMYKVSFGDKGTVWLPEKYLISLFRSETN